MRTLAKTEPDAPMALEEAVWVDPARMSGVHCFRGTRLPCSSSSTGSRMAFRWTTFSTIFRSTLGLPPPSLHVVRCRTLIPCSPAYSIGYHSNGRDSSTPPQQPRSLGIRNREEQRLRPMSSRRLPYTADDALSEPSVSEAISRGIIEVRDNRITYNLGVKKSYDWSDPEEWVRPRTIAFSNRRPGLPCE